LSLLTDPHMSDTSLNGEGILGVYDFEHAGGHFDVTLRSGGRFFCERFQAARSSWKLEGNLLTIDWGKFGKYALEFDTEFKTASGSAVGNPDSWRKMAFKRPFNAAELALFDSKWMFMHAGGEFEVEFRADSFNHFVCPSFPAHSHWLFKDESVTPTVYINWGKYGEYLVKLAEDGSTFEGSVKGKESSWRKGRRLGACSTGSVHEHSH